MPCILDLYQKCKVEVQVAETPIVEETAVENGRLVGRHDTLHHGAYIHMACHS